VFPIDGRRKAIASHRNVPFNPVVALLIATIKATLVILFFMHVKGASEKLTAAVVVSGFFFLLILLALSLADYMTRSWR